MDSTSSATLPLPVTELETPCFLVDVGKVKKNAAGMLEKCKRAGVKLRPHMKTTKTIEAGEIATGDTKRGICVSTLAEAEFYADAGFDDILYAMLFSHDKMKRITALTGKLECFNVAVDSVFGCELLEKTAPPPGKQWSVFLLVDTGSGREGSRWDSPVTLDLGRRLAEHPHVLFRGLYTHEGASYGAGGTSGVDGVRGVYGDAVSRVREVAARLKAQGVECAEVTIGATPTASLDNQRIEGITEIHPGNYLFYDAQQKHMGSCTEDEIACRVAMRVVGHYPNSNQLLVDGGWASVTVDGKLANGSNGYFQGYPHLRLRGMTQEYGFVDFDSAQHKCEDFPHGTMLFLYPYHSCNTSMRFRKYFLVDNDTVTGTWTPCSQW